MVCPKCTALSEIFTNSPLTIIPDSIPLENLPLKNNNLLLLPLKSISNSEAYVSQTLTRIDNADLHGANSVMSSAEARAPAKRLPIWHPTPVSSSYRFNNPYYIDKIVDAKYTWYVQMVFTDYYYDILDVSFQCIRLMLGVMVRRNPSFYLSSSLMPTTTMCLNTAPSCGEKP